MADQVVSSVSVDFNAKDGVTGTINRMRGQFKHLRKDIDGTSAKFKQLGSSAMAVGKQMSMKMTLPLVAAGGAAFKMASDFESSMTKIQSLVGRSEEEVQGLTRSVLKLSGETARAPQELADAMFFITSAGIEGADAASVLEASAKAAAVGLGEAATIADLATSAMNAYGKENLGASDATDVMVAAVREGKLEASELAGSMGRVLPVASAMGVSFNEVGAAFAALSRTGTNAAEAATQVRGIMTSLLKPTQQAEEALTEMGLSSEGLRTQIKDEGLLSTLQTLATEFDGNAAASASVFGNVRALSGVMDLMGKNVAGTEAIFASMNNTLGATDKAFAVTAETTEFKMNQAIADFKVAMIAVGQEIIPVVLPIIQKMSEFIGGLVKRFSNLSGPVKTMIVVFAGLAAVAGPLLIAIGAIVSAIGALGPAMTAALGPIGLAITAVAALGFLYMKHKADQAEFNAKVDEAKEVLQKMNPELDGAVDRMQSLADSLPEVTEPMDHLNAALENYSQKTLIATKMMDSGMSKAFQTLSKNGVELDKVLASDLDNLDAFITELDKGNGITNAAMHEISGMSKEGRQLARDLADLHEAEEITIKDMRNLVDAVDETIVVLKQAEEASIADAQAFLESDDALKVLTQSMGFTTDAALVYYANLRQIAEDEGPREAVARMSAAVDEQTLAHHFAAAEFADYRGEVEKVEAANKDVLQTWEQLRDAAEGRALFFTLALDTTGLYEQLNEAMNAIIDVGSLMPGGDSRALETQLAISQRISAKLIETKAEDRKTMSAAAKAAATKFENFVKNSFSLGSSVLTDSFAEAIVGSPEQIGKAFDKLFDDAFDTGLTQIPELRSVFEKAIEQKGGLIDLAKLRTKLTEDLVTAEDRLATAIQNQASAQSRVNSLMDQRSQTAQKTASAFGFTFGETPGANASGRAKQLLNTYTAFHLNLTKLRDRGFPIDIISQVIGLGAFEGNQTAQALLAMGDTDFSEFLTSLAGISTIGASIGNLQAGMMFDSAITAANDQLSSASSGVVTARTGVGQAELALGLVAPAMANLAQAMQGDFAGGIKDFISTLGPLPDNLQRVFDIFLAKLGSLGGSSRGIFDVLMNPASGTVPSMMQQIAKASTGIAGINGAAGGGAGSGSAPGSRSNPIAIVPIAAPSAAMSALIDAGSLDTMRSLDPVMRTRGAGFAFADAGSMGLGLGRAGQSTNVDALPGGGVVINVQGSVVTERELLETIRQGALEMQRSGKSWTVDVL
jgi:TP901 family phage tail tape measure protein